jgi:uncharacterized OB-fold protein
VQVTNSLLAPDISPSPEATPFWDAANRHELKLPYCSNCREFFFYPRTLCPACGSRDITWRLASGRGHVYTFCIQYQTSAPGLRDGLPFVTAIIDLEEGPRLMSFLVDVSPDPESVSCDMPVHVAFVELPDGQTLPVFRPL